jgi:membrane protein implicated in regulation of membrane protease activity
MWSGRVLAKYWAIQLPGTVIVIVALLAAEASLGWPQWLFWTITALWVAKDALLYPFVWRAYDPGYPLALLRLEGAKGRVVDRIAPSGRVRVSGELWRAELAHGAPGIERGEAVRVKARRGLTLLVEPLSATQPGSRDSR